MAIADFDLETTNDVQQFSGSHRVENGELLHCVGAARFEEILNMGAVLTQPILTIDLIDDDSNFTEELNGSFDKSDNTEGPLENDGSMLMTQTAAAGLKQIYQDFTGTSRPDLSMYDKVGFWYKGGNSDVFAAGDIQLLFFTEGNTAAANAVETFSVPAFTEAATAVWKYVEFTFSNTIRKTRKNITRVAFYSAAGTNGNALAVAHLEAFRYSTGNGPARGRIKREPIKSGVTLTQGDPVDINGSGRVLAITDNSYAFYGITVVGGVGNAAGTVYADVMIPPFVHNLKSDKILTAGDGIVFDGTGGDIDDGGAASEISQQGVALKTCIADDLLPCLFRTGGGVGTVGA